MAPDSVERPKSFPTLYCCLPCTAYLVLLPGLHQVRTATCSQFITLRLRGISHGVAIHNCRLAAGTRGDCTVLVHQMHHLCTMQRLTHPKHCKNIVLVRSRDQLPAEHPTCLASDPAHCFWVRQDIQNVVKQLHLEQGSILIGPGSHSPRAFIPRQRFRMPCKSHSDQIAQITRWMKSSTAQSHQLPLIYHSGSVVTGLLVEDSLCPVELLLQFSYWNTAKLC